MQAIDPNAAERCENTLSQKFEVCSQGAGSFYSTNDKVEISLALHEMKQSAPHAAALHPVLLTDMAYEARKFQ